MSKFEAVVFDIGGVVMDSPLGLNLKPARALGMATIKVVEPDAALRELGALLGLDLLS